MSLKEICIEKSYISYGDQNLVDSLIGPALRNSKSYKRSAGFFSSSVFTQISDAIIQFVRSGGRIQLICGLELSEEDKNAIELGYSYKENILDESFEAKFILELEQLSDDNLQLLSELVANDFLNIKLAITKNAGIYHDKLGIFEDLEGNKAVFYGSANATGAAYSENYEKIRTAVSWKSGFDEIVIDECNEFDSLWNDSNQYVEVYDFTDKVNSIVVREKNIRKNNKEINKGVKLYDYQEEAIQAWVNNDYHGFYVMATGTGKTWTAIYSIKRLLQDHDNIITVICAPYKHLIKQWKEDVVNLFPNYKIIMVSSENPGWDIQITNEIINQKYNTNNRIIILATIASFNTERFKNTIKKSSQEKLLIVDEAHRFTQFNNEMKTFYDYHLGLSATPGNGKNEEFVKELMTFFGGEVYNLPIEEALRREFLVKYNYYPIYVYATEDDEEAFNDISKKMASCFRNGKCIDTEKLAKLSKARLRVISMASEKIDRIDDILDQIDEKDHFIIYCGDGRLFNDNNEEMRHIEYIKSILDRRNKKACQFTASENMSKRMELVDGFNKMEFDSLVAIRCLDEGINIPSIKGALILSSNDDYREFVQRRGRILRKYNGKKSANIYDVIVLPSRSNSSWASIELRRFYEYARLADNKKIQLKELDELMNEFNLSLDTIGTYSGVEDEMDE